MEIKHVKDCELKRVNEMYEDFLVRNPEYKGDSLDYIVNKLSRCEKCGEITENDNMCDATLEATNKTYHCCNRCRYEIEWENYHNENILEESYEQKGKSK